MSTNTGNGEASVVPAVVIAISYNPSNGVILFQMPEHITPVMLYGLLELAKDEVRRRNVDAIEREHKLVHLAPGRLPGL